MDIEETNEFKMFSYDIKYQTYVRNNHNNYKVLIRYSTPQIQQLKSKSLLSNSKKVHRGKKKCSHLIK